MGPRAHTRNAILILAIIVSYPSYSAIAPVREFLISRLPTQGLASRSAVVAFYENRDGRPVWMTGQPARDHLDRVMEHLNNADAEGLSPDDYHVDTLAFLTARPDWLLSTHDIALRDVLLTDALLTYARDLTGERVNPEVLYDNWSPPDRDLDPAKCLATALEAGEDPLPVLAALHPDHPSYVGLCDMLSRYLWYAEANSWPTVPGGPALLPGDTDPRIEILRVRLAAEDHTGVRTDGDPGYFDTGLELAVRSCQARHGLVVDGIVGPATLAVINVTASTRASQVTLNLERLRWLPRECTGNGTRTIFVNIPSFTLEVVEQGKTVLSMRAIVGRTDRPTPVLSGSMTYMEVNPFWNIPQNLARRDVLPHIRHNPAYLTERNIHVFESWRTNAPELAPDTVDWRGLKARSMAFKLQQSPGPLNPLGRVKFMFANEFSVYIHDTPTRAKFALDRRCFSSGCVRVEDPLALAAYLLNHDEITSGEEFWAAFDNRETHIEGLPEPVAVHLIYLTAWTDRDGRIHFRDDIYGYDDTLLTALASR